MGSNKKYAGYKSFEYLEGDLKQFKLAKEIRRVNSSVVKLNRTEEEKVDDVLSKNIAISIHDHPSLFPDDIEEVHEYIRYGREFMGYEGLSVSGLDAVFDGLGDGTNTIFSRYPWKWESVVYEIGMRLADIAHQDFVIRGEKVDDIIKAHREGKVALVLHIEGAMPIENELDRVDVLYGLGVRCMGLVYSEANAIGAGLREKSDGGLTNFGYQVVERMNKIGMAVDLAHVGDKTSLDAIAASSLPVFITHAGARSLWNTSRMKPDNVLEALADKKGVIGIEAAPHTTLTKKHIHHSLDSVMEHFQYIEKLIGIDHVTFGPDTLFGDHVGLHHLFARELSIKETHAGAKFEEVPFVDGLENPSEFRNIVRWLVKNGYSDGEIAKVIGGNTLRVLRKVWK
ncbi:MAG: membrane dipeptidase [Nitrososphaerota archaeon]|jgi:membrane dipeptidase|nr:membrane dipeptidase [Nitrososphaerota archaeon]